MKDCSICKYCDIDYDFDEEECDEYPIYIYAKKETTHHLITSVKTLNDTVRKNIKRKIQSAINVSILRFVLIMAMLLIAGQFAIQEVII